LSAAVQNGAECCKKLPHPKTDKHLQNALASAVGAEVEMEYAYAQLAVELIMSTKSLLTLLFMWVSTVYVPKPI